MLHWSLSETNGALSVSCVDEASGITKLSNTEQERDEVCLK